MKWDMCYFYFTFFISAPFSGSRQKRFDLPWFFGKFNDLPDHPDVPIPPGVADTTQDTPIGGTCVML